MKKSILVAAIAVALVFSFCAVAFADHAPNFYVAWSGGSTANNGTGSPHQNYQVTTEKCAVCHGVHRAAVEGEAFGTVWTAEDGPDTQMLLRSNVANACNYCHINTAVGGIRLYNGNSLNLSGTVAPWAVTGYGHTYGCSGCHAVHGAKTFKGAIATKILRYNISKSGLLTGINTGTYSPLGNAAPIGAEHDYLDPAINQVTQVAIQDEIWQEGNGTTVSNGSLAMFTGNDIANPIEGTNVSGTVDAQLAQDSAFCTICHANYSSASEVIVNLDGEMALFNPAYNWTGSTPGSFRYKNHPVQPATSDFAAGGSTIGTGQVVAFEDASTCRACHDAGEINAAQLQPDGYVVENSYPHSTPGYWKFMTSASSTADPALGQTNLDNYVDGAVVTTPSLPASLAAPIASGGEDGHCLKCHREGVPATPRGVGLTY